MAARKRKQKANLGRVRPLSPGLLRDALFQRIVRQIAVAGSIKIPAVPALLDHYLDVCAGAFRSVGRGLGEKDLQGARTLIAERLEQAFAFSQRSKIAIDFSAPPGGPLTYEVRTLSQSVAGAYEHWLAEDECSLFGIHADARILALCQPLDASPLCPILDFGAGTGRNTLALARLGYSVDAVEITPRFAEAIQRNAEREGLSVRVVQGDVFLGLGALRRDYKLLFASEVVSDFRDIAQLRQLFVLASQILVEGGIFVFNGHLTRAGYTPERGARQFAKQCYSALYTPHEVAQAAEGLPFELVANDAVLAYEQEHIPAEFWPPTPWFISWASGQDVYEVPREKSPVELRWLVFRKGSTLSSVSGLAAQLGVRGEPAFSPTDERTASESTRIDPVALREAVRRRLSRRTVATGQLIFPAVPEMSERYAGSCKQLFGALGRSFTDEEFSGITHRLKLSLTSAFAASARSTIQVDFEVPMGVEIRYEMTEDAVPLAQAYEDWYDSLPHPLFGAGPDARLVAVVEGLGEAAVVRALDVGAGLGRNAFWLAERGHWVDAVELSGRFVDEMASVAKERKLPIRLILGDIFECEASLAPNYSLVLLAGVAADFRDVHQLRRLFELACERLESGGMMVLSIHVTAVGFEPEESLCQWGQQCCAMFFTPAQLREASAGLALERLSDDSALEYEKAHLSPNAWPPTPVFEEWASARHMLALPREQSPIELRWVVYRRV